MKSVIQRVKSAEVRVEGEVIGRIDGGMVVLVGVERGDGEADAVTTARKLASLRIFAGRTPMDLDIVEVGGACMVISQFTLAASIRKGRRPGFDGAEAPERANLLYLRVVDELRSLGVSTRTGRFGAAMEVVLVNDGPVTFVVQTRNGTLSE